MTEQDSKDMVEESLWFTNPTPKRVKLMKGPSWKNAADMDFNK